MSDDEHDEGGDGEATAQQNNLVVGGVAALIGVVVLVVGLWMRASAAERATWPTAEGTVLSTSISSERKRTGTRKKRRTKTMYTAHVRYRYTVDGKRYESRKIGPSQSSTSSRSSAQAVLDRYPSGSKIQAIYNPDDPREAYLEPGGGGFALILILAGGLLLAGGGAVAAGVMGDVGQQVMQQAAP